MLAVPEQNAGLCVGSNESRVERDNPLPRPSGHIAFDAAQDMGGFLCCKRRVLAHVKLLINQHPQVILLRTALNTFSTQHLFVHRILVLCIILVSFAHAVLIYDKQHMRKMRLVYTEPLQSDRDTAILLLLLDLCSQKKKKRVGFILPMLGI